MDRIKLLHLLRQHGWKMTSKARIALASVIQLHGIYLIRFRQDRGYRRIFGYFHKPQPVAFACGNAHREIKLYADGQGHCWLQS